MGQAKRRKLAGTYPSNQPLDAETITKGRGTKFGDFFTPPAVAKEMAEYLRPKLRAFAAAGKVARVLEPCAGTGNLIWPLLEVAREEGCNLEIVAIEIQKDYLVELIAKAIEVGCAVDVGHPGRATLFFFPAALALAA